MWTTAHCHPGRRRRRRLAAERFTEETAKRVIQPALQALQIDSTAVVYTGPSCATPGAPSAGSPPSRTAAGKSRVVYADCEQNSQKYGPIRCASALAHDGEIILSAERGILLEAGGIYGRCCGAPLKVTYESRNLPVPRCRVAYQMVCLKISWIPISAHHFVKGTYAFGMCTH